MNLADRFLSGFTAVVLVLGGLWLSLWVIIRSMTHEALATLLLAAIITFVGGAGLMFVIFRAVSMERTGEARDRRAQQMNPADARALMEWIAANGAGQPVREIASPYMTPAPVRVRVPVVIGSSGPQTASQHAVIVESMSEDGKVLEIPYSRLVKFASCPTPSRSEWRGKAEHYTDCSAWFKAHGLLLPGPGTGQHWSPSYPVDSRIQWLDEIERAALPH